MTFRLILKHDIYDAFAIPSSPSISKIIKFSDLIFFIFDLKFQPCTLLNQYNKDLVHYTKKTKILSPVLNFFNFTIFDQKNILKFCGYWDIKIIKAPAGFKLTIYRF